MILSLILVGVAVGLPLQVAWIYGHGMAEWDSVLTKLTVLNWFVVAGSLTCSRLVWNAEPSSALAMGALTLLVAVNNFVVGMAGTDFSWAECIVATLLFSGLNAPLWFGTARAALRDPARRWWLRARRLRRNVHTVVSRSRRAPLKVETFDISESGMFIPLTGPELNVDDDIAVHMSLGAFRHLRCRGRVVRMAGPVADYPGGVGVQFVDLNWDQRRELRTFLDS